MGVTDGKLKVEGGRKVAVVMGSKQESHPLARSRSSSRGRPAFPVRSDETCWEWWAEPDMDTPGTWKQEWPELSVEHGAIIRGAQHRIKLWGPLFKICQGFQGGNRGASDPGQGLLSRGPHARAQGAPPGHGSVGAGQAPRKQ